MNIDRLAKLYATLTPRERLPLIIAAGARGDETEQKRLSASAPKVSPQVPDYHALAKALLEAVHYHLETLLDLAAKFWQWWGLWMAYDTRAASAAGDRKCRRRKAVAEVLQEWRAHDTARYYASRFVAHVDGWKQFCAELKIDPGVLLEFMIGWGTIMQTEKTARAMAFSVEEAARFVDLETVPVEGDDSRERRPVSVETVEELAEGWHVILDKMVCRRWM